MNKEQITKEFREKFKDLSHTGCDNRFPCATVIDDVEKFWLLKLAEYVQAKHKKRAKKCTSMYKLKKS